MRYNLVHFLISLISEVPQSWSLVRKRFQVRMTELNKQRGEKRFQREK